MIGPGSLAALVLARVEDEPGEWTITELARDIPVSVPRVSAALKRLRARGYDPLLPHRDAQRGAVRAEILRRRAVVAELAGLGLNHNEIGAYLGRHPVAVAADLERVGGSVTLTQPPT